MNKFVEVNGNKHYIYSYGQGTITLVLLSGSGVPFPSLEYMHLTKALAESYKIIGIEKLGYGYSDLAEESREIDKVILEYRCILQQLEIKTPIILAAHSMGFLEAVRWGQQYPSEILAILGIDPATPECYKDFDIEKAKTGLIEISKNEHLKKISANALIKQFTKDYDISSTEKKKLENLAYRNLANQNWISEAENLKDTLILIEENNPYLQIPMLFFLSNGEGTTLEKNIWRHHALQYLSNIKIAQYELFEYPHNLYKFAYKEMAQTAEKFISNYIGESIF